MSDRDLLLKIFIHDNYGKMVKEYFYSDFVEALDKVLNHNIENEDDEWIIINDFKFPPKNKFWSTEKREWKEIKEKRLFLSNKISL